MITLPAHVLVMRSAQGFCMANALMGQVIGEPIGDVNVAGVVLVDWLDIDHSAAVELLLSLPLSDTFPNVSETWQLSGIEDELVRFVVTYGN